MIDLLRANDGTPAGVIRFDARVVQRAVRADTASVRPGSSYELGRERDPAFTELLRNLMHAQPGILDDTARVCATSSLRSCTLRDAVAYFAEPVVTGDAAEVIVKAMWLGDLAKQPVQDGVFAVTLRKGQGGWKAVASRTLFIS
jgi:hypothetical protein